MLAGHALSRVSWIYMVGDTERAKRAIIGYMSAQLQSALAAMEAALALNDPQLSFEAAQRYMYIAELARQLYLDQDSYGQTVNKQVHNWSILKQTLQAYPNIVIVRTQRLPYVQGDIKLQGSVISSILNNITGSNLVITFRSRGDDLVVACRGATNIPEEFTVAGSRNVLLMAARELSLTAIKGYLLARKSKAAGIRIIVTRNTVFLHFSIIRQLKMSL